MRAETRYLTLTHAAIAAAEAGDAEELERLTLARDEAISALGARPALADTLEPRLLAAVEAARTEVAEELRKLGRGRRARFASPTF